MSTPAQTVSRPADAPTSPSVSLRGPTLLWGLVWVLATLGLAALAFKRLFPHDLIDPDAMDFAQIARNMATGHGYSTSIFRPLALSGFVAPSAQDPTAVLDVSRPPLFPALLMLAFVAHGGHGGGPVVVLTSLLFFLASAVAVFFLARRLFPGEGQPWLALLSAGLYVLGSGALGYSVSGLPVSLATLLVTLLLIALHKAHEVGGRPIPPTRCLWVGLLLGLCYLTQYSLLLLVIPTLVYVYASRAPMRAGRGVAFCVLGFLIATGGWLVRTAIVAHGNPFFTLLLYGVMADTPDYPGATSIYRSVLPTVGPFAFFFSHMPDMAAKAGRNLYFYQTRALDVFSIFVLAPALASLLWRFADPRVGALRGYVAVNLLLLVLVTSFFAPSLLVILPFAPALAALAVGLVFSVLQQQRAPALAQRMALWGWATLVGVGLLASFAARGVMTLNPIQNGISMLADPPVQPPYKERIAKSIKGGAVITDSPWEVTWRLPGQPALWLPRDNTAYEAVVAQAPGDGGKVPASCVLLTPNMAAYSRGEDADAWAALSTNTQVYDQYQVVQGRIKRLKAVPAPLQQQTTLAVYKQQMQGQLQKQWEDRYGSLSQIIADYETDPRVLRQPEANGLASTLFLRRDFLLGLKKPKAKIPPQ